MQHAKRKHTLRNLILIVILVLIVGVSAYGMERYRSIKSTVNSSFKASGVAKQRNVSQQIKEKKPISILLLGTDTGALDRTYKGRTDSMMIVTLSPGHSKTTVTSIPRDTAVTIPGFEGRAPSKINAAYSWGSSKTTIKSVQEMLNIPIDFYALVNMGGMKKVINEVKGVDVVPTLSFRYEGYAFKKGVKTHMDGAKALAYSRMRYDDPDNDYGRQKRQRSVLMALVKKSGSISTLLNQSFLNSLSSQVQTDLSFDTLTELTKNYHSADKNVTETHLQGHGEELNGQDMEVMHKKELQRVTNYVRNGLELAHKTTGTAAIFTNTDNLSSTNSSEKSSSSVTESGY